MSEEDHNNKKFEVFCCLSDIRRGIEDALNYMQRVEVFFHEEDTKIGQIVQKQINSNPSAEDDILDSWSLEFHLNGFHYPNILRISMVLALYNLLESGLNNLCDLLKDIRNLSLSLKDLKNNGICRAKLFLDKVVGIEFEPVNSQWSFLTGVNKLRNCLVHNSGKLRPDGNNSLFKFIEQCDELSISQGVTVEIDSKFIGHFAKQAVEFLKYLESQINKVGRVEGRNPSRQAQY